MVELSTSNKNTYFMNGQELGDKFNAPYDFDTREDNPLLQQLSIELGLPVGKSMSGNLGQTLIPGNISASGKSSKSSNVEVIINGKGSIRQRTVGFAHEFGHVILYLRGLPYGHGQPGGDDFVYGRATMMSKRLGYDF